jgi:hypothetical protein
MKVTVNRFILILTAAALSGGSPVWAHHGSRISYDMTRQITAKGAIRQFSFQNPHVYFTFEVRDDRGNVSEWVAETEPPVLMESRFHWNRDYLRPGDPVTVTVWPVKSGTSRGLLVRLVTADGRVTDCTDPQGD